MKNISSLNNIKRKFDIFLHFDYDSINMETFVEKVMNILLINSTYSMLIKFSDLENRVYKMAGEQIAVITTDKLDPKYFESLFNVIQQRIENALEIYDMTLDVGSIEIMFTIISCYDEEVRIKNVNNIQFSKNHTNISKTKKEFNDNTFPLTLNEKYYGNEIFDISEKSKFIEKITSQNILTKNLDISINNIMYLRENNQKIKSIIIIKNINENITEKHIFDFNTGHKIVSIRDEIILDNNANNTVSLDNQIKLKSRFKRKISNNTLFISNNKVTEVNTINKLYPINNREILDVNIKNTDKIQDRNTNFGTFDIETFLDSDGISKVYALGFAINTENKVKLYYVTDDKYINSIIKENRDNYMDQNMYREISDKLVLDCINDMLIHKYHNFIFYVHNFGKFDVIFLYNVLLRANDKLGFDYYILTPIMRDNIIIKLTIKIKPNLSKDPSKILDDTETMLHPPIVNRAIKISFVDSYNLLHSSLAKLAIDFNVKTQKGYFPYEFVSRNNLNYIGSIPDFSYYKNTPKEIYENMKNDNNSTVWNLKTETLNYLKQDLLSLLQIIEEFSRSTYIYFNVDITRCLTITRLALNIFLKKYYKQKNIPKINNYAIFDFVKQAYFGGITEVYKPYGENLAYIDVNSLYPFAALNFLPGLNCKFIESFEEAGLNLNELFGFFNARIQTPADSYIGLLPLQDIKDNLTLNMPLGEFQGTWSSEELKFAQANGYKITVIKGYQFNKVEGIFNEYVNTLYEMKSNNSGTTKQIAKSLLNNLLGRFGLNITKPITALLDTMQRDKILSTRVVHGIKTLENNHYLITYDPLPDRKIVRDHGLDFSKVITQARQTSLEKSLTPFSDVSIATSAMINSYARIFINQIKLYLIENNISIYYSDTDSLVLDVKGLEILRQKNLIGDKIGQFKFEHLIKQAFFISNKTYCLVLQNDQSIIKAKGVISNNLTVKQFESMYYNKTNIKTHKTLSQTNYAQGAVNILEKEVILNHDVFKKRIKIYNSNGLWVDTQPLSINQNT